MFFVTSLEANHCFNIAAPGVMFAGYVPVVYEMLIVGFRMYVVNSDSATVLGLITASLSIVEFVARQKYERNA